MSEYERIIGAKSLKNAWRKVRKNKPAAGVDDISCDDFESNLNVELSQLHNELYEHTYQVMPVKLVKLVREDKLREVTLYTMRDKVVQAALSELLVDMYDDTFSECAYAYRKDKSALVAIDNIDAEVTSGKWKYAYKADISAFFDNINLDKLNGRLMNDIKEIDVVELIMTHLRTPSVNIYGELVEKQVGVYQGASISPVLSNLYLRDFDDIVEKEGLFYVRYADDMVVLAENMEQVNRVSNVMEALLKDLGLELNERKSYSRSIEEGFEFLGYQFSDSGRAIPKKAKDKLETSLEDVWLTMKDATLDDKLHKGCQILNGWEQYFRGDRAIGSLYEYVVLIYMMRDKDELKEMSTRRIEYHNTYKDICRFLVGVWQENKWDKLELLEYEQFFGISQGNLDYNNELYEKELLANYRKLIDGETEELWSAILQTYSDMGEYDNAENVMSRISQIKEEPHNSSSIKIDNQETAIDYDARTISLFEDLFVGRVDMYVREQLNPDKKRKCLFVPEPLTKDVIRKHLIGQETIGSYLVRNNDTVHYIVIDVDINRKMILEGEGDEGIFNDHLHNAAKQARDIQHKLRELGLRTYIEFSGYRGYHVWLLFSEWIPLRYVYSLIEILQSKIDEKYDDISLEYFPKKNKKKAGRSGQNIKMPYAIHLTSGKRSFFCNDDFTPVEDINDVLGSFTRYSMANIKKVIGSNISEANAQTQIRNQEEIQIDYSRMSGIPKPVKVVLDKCSLMKYLVNKAMTTGYLGHFERLSILHVFGHLGEDGKEFVHTVMSFTINYQHHVTQKFIEKMPGKPVSCIKLRDQYKQVTAEYGCSCRFRRTKNCYPSPVLHALRDNGEKNHDITIPISRTLSKAKEEKVYEELDVHNKVQDCANRLVELKKQKRGVDKSIARVEKELSDLFDTQNVDCIEVEMGLLVRRKEQEKYTWYIEI